jgi:hypothetical protein
MSLAYLCELVVKQTPPKDLHVNDRSFEPILAFGGGKKLRHNHNTSMQMSFDSRTMAHSNQVICMIYECYVSNKHR